MTNLEKSHSSLSIEGKEVDNIDDVQKETSFKLLKFDKKYYDTSKRGAYQIIFDDKTFTLIEASTVTEAISKVTNSKEKNKKIIKIITPIQKKRIYSPDEVALNSSSL